MSLKDIQVDRNIKAAEYKSNGFYEQAIELYELNIADRFEGSAPYTQLAFIYRQEKRYEDEVRVLKIAIDLYSQLKKTSPRRDVESKLQIFIGRLAKAEKFVRRHNIAHID